MTQGTLIFLYIIIEKKYFLFKKIIFSFIFLIIIKKSIFTYLKIDFYNFYIQYFDFPLSIGSARIEDHKFSFNGFFSQFKFLILPLIFITYLKVKRILKKKSSIFEKDFFGFLILFSFIVCILYHQIMTRNQIFVYFIIPILFGLLYSELKLHNFKYKKYLLIAVLISVFLITFKYHLRFNENRKFHELENVEISKAQPASQIDKSLGYLLWVNPLFDGDPEEEIILIKKGIKKLNEQKDEIMLISDYLFLDSLTINKLNYPSRSNTLDGASIPTKNNKYFDYYKNFLQTKIKKNNIKNILFFKHEKISHRTFTDYVDETCYDKSDEEIFYVYKLKCFN